MLLTPLSSTTGIIYIDMQSGQNFLKQNLAQPIDTRHPSHSIALSNSKLLQQPRQMGYPENMLKQAIAQWDNTPLQNQQQLKPA
jgi:glutamyl-Q tRNA(Asp) synthetase